MAPGCLPTRTSSCAPIALAQGLFEHGQYGTDARRVDTVADCAPKRYQEMPSASNARARSASRSATGERTCGAIQSVAEFEVICEIVAALGVGQPRGTQAAGVFQQ